MAPEKRPEVRVWGQPDLQSSRGTIGAGQWKCRQGGQGARSQSGTVVGARREKRRGGVCSAFLDGVSERRVGHTSREKKTNKRTMAQCAMRQKEKRNANRTSNWKLHVLKGCGLRLASGGTSQPEGADVAVDVQGACARARVHVHVRVCVRKWVCVYARARAREKKRAPARSVDPWGPRSR